MKKKVEKADSPGEPAKAKDNEKWPGVRRADIATYPVRRVADIQLNHILCLLPGIRILRNFKHLIQVPSSIENNSQRPRQLFCGCARHPATATKSIRRYETHQLNSKNLICEVATATKRAAEDSSCKSSQVKFTPRP
mmetsp:Transcript_10940/g.30627  ORF Transcript_10940/g.30627 Transcript_10940/m.30627 type:complete len:137 (+) Transcript_10940:386-796(+)